jgi:O6-methylguanine-DNA--protein-cysteine methyltransferase
MFECTISNNVYGQFMGCICIYTDLLLGNTSFLIISCFLVLELLSKMSRANHELSDFAKLVLYATSKIPKGKVCTYGAIVSAIGRGAAQAVGGALKRNP